MSLDQQLLAILKRLVEKSRSGQVNWREAEISNQFLVAFSESVLSLQFLSPVAEPDRIVILVMTRTGRELWRSEVEDGDPEWPTVHELFLDAKRRVVGLEKILEKIEKEISE